MLPTKTQIIAAVLSAQDHSVAPNTWARYCESKKINIAHTDITPEQAQSFYNDLFEASNVKSLPRALHYPVFDWYSNSGYRSVESLQRLLNTTVGDDTRCLDVDGRIGSKTAALSNAVCNTGFINAYALERIKFYTKIVARTPSYAKLLNRWMDRTNKFFSFSADFYANRVVRGDAT